MRRMLAVVIAFLTFLPFVAAGPAHAGGPTSVLLVDPSTGRTASLYLNDAAYDDLGRLVGAFEWLTDGAPAEKVAEPASDELAGRVITATWLIHDVSVWRVDRIHIDAAGGPVLETLTAVDGADILATEPVRHASSDGQELSALLTKLGMGPSLTGAEEWSGASDNASAPVTPAAPVADAPSSTDTAEGAAASTGSPVAWGGGGLLLGLLLALGATLLLRRRRSELVVPAVSTPEGSTRESRSEGDVPAATAQRDVIWS